MKREREEMWYGRRKLKLLFSLDQRNLSIQGPGFGGKSLGAPSSSGSATCLTASCPSMLAPPTYIHSHKLFAATPLKDMEMFLDRPTAHVESENPRTSGRSDRYHARLHTMGKHVESDGELMAAAQPGSRTRVLPTLQTRHTSCA